MKIQILLSYWNRPKIVRNAIQSVKESTFTDWELAFCDDGSDFLGEPIVREMLTSEQLAKTKFYNTYDTKEGKMSRGHSTFGKMINQAIRETDAEICVFLCDDDALFPTYLQGLSDFWEANPLVPYAYSHIILFDPLAESFDDVKGRTEASDYLSYGGAVISPVNHVDASQVAWKRVCSTEGNCWFPELQTAAIDAAMFGQLCAKYGGCVCTGLIGQFKGWHSRQLGRNMSNHINNVD